MIVFINKPIGIFTRKAYKSIASKYKKCGHAGTLDLFAKGVLIVGTDSDTKKLSLFVNCFKSYYFELVWGIETETNDIFGKTILKKSLEYIDLCKIHACIYDILLNNYYQLPPRKCAKKLLGTRMYKMNFNNISDDDLFFKRKLVKISKIDVIYHSISVTGFYIECSSGFYVRSFVRDLAIKLNTLASAMNIFRISIGGVNISSIINL